MILLTRIEITNLRSIARGTIEPLSDGGMLGVIVADAVPVMSEVFGYEPRMGGVFEETLTVSVGVSSRDSSIRR